MDEDANVADSVEETSDTEAVEDVKEGSEQTETAPSGGEKTSEDESKAGTLADGTSEDKPVPYSEFKEANDRATEAMQKAEDFEKRLAEVEKQPQPGDPYQDPNYKAQADQFKNQLEGMGFVTKEQQEAELQRREEDAQVQRELDTLETRYDGKDGRPKFKKDEVINFALDKRIGDLEAAYKILNEKKIADWQIKQASSKTKGFKTEASTGTGSTEAGTTETDLKDAITKGDKGALNAYLKRRIRYATDIK